MQQIQVIAIVNMGAAIIIYIFYRSYLNNNNKKHNRQTELKEHTHTYDYRDGSNYIVKMHGNIENIHRENYDFQTLSVIVYLYVMLSFLFIIFIMSNTYKIII